MYNHRFFERLSPTSDPSARAIVPYVVGMLRPKSVVDVGCGTGTWLEQFSRYGIDDILGVDGYSPHDVLRIPQEKFVRHDLSTPFLAGRKYDLAVSLEVAEHLPPESAGTFVDTLVGLAPRVLFSAAVPGQARDHEAHPNEQWPEYWADLFAARGYLCYDVIRPAVRRNQDVAWWYRQNTLLFVHGAIEMPMRPAERVKRLFLRPETPLQRKRGPVRRALSGCLRKIRRG